MSGRAHFRPGDAIAHRSVDRDERIVLTVFPQIVVLDDAGLIATYMPSGVVGKHRSGERGAGPRGRHLVRWDGGHADRPWTGTNVLMLHRPGDPYSVWSAWRVGTWEQAWWYVNLEDPWRRTSIGFDTRDRELDLWSEPAVADWHWKDEDEFAWAIEQGRFTAAEAAAIREDGERAVESIRRAEPPFDRDWSGWRPDPAWPTPALPETWNAFEP